MYVCVCVGGGWWGGGHFNKERMVFSKAIAKIGLETFKKCKEQPTAYKN
jgi:hypothetical protein